MQRQLNQWLNTMYQFICKNNKFKNNRTMENINNKSMNVLLIVAAIIMALMGAVMFYQDKTLTEMRQLLEKTDTITYADTIYLDKVIRDTMPQTITQRIYKTDTLWKVQGDSVVGEPQIITLVKKKSAKH